MAAVQEQDDPEYTETRLRQCLATLVRKYNARSVQFDVSQRISLEDALTLVGEELNDRVTQPTHKLTWQNWLRNS